MAMTTAEELTSSEKGLKRVYDFLQEQADALRAAKQAAIQSRIASQQALRRESSGVGGEKAKIDSTTRTSVSSSIMSPSSSASSSIAGVTKRTVKRPTMVPCSSSSARDRPSASHPSPGLLSEDDETSAASTTDPLLPSIPSTTASLSSNLRKRPSRPSAAPKPKAHQEFSIPKKGPGGMGVDSCAPPIPRKDPNAESSSSTAAAAAEAPPPPEKEEAFPFIPGRSLDRNRFDPKHLLCGLKQEWNSRTAEHPLVVPLPDFGFEMGKHNVLVIRASAGADAKRFALNLCPRPLVPGSSEALEAAPKEILAHFNPRRIYKNGSIVYNARREGQWTEEPPPTVALANLPRLFGSYFTLFLKVEFDRVQLLIGDDQIETCDMPLPPGNLGEELALHLPAKEETVGFQEEWIVHEIWWGTRLPSPGLGLGLDPTESISMLLHQPHVLHQALPSLLPSLQSAAAAAAAAAAASSQQQHYQHHQSPPPSTSPSSLPHVHHHQDAAADASPAAPPAAATRGPVRPRLRDLPAAPDSSPAGSTAVGDEDGRENGMMDADTGSIPLVGAKLGGLLDAGFGAGLAQLVGGGGAGGDGMVVAVNNLPEAKDDQEVDEIKSDLLSMFSQVGSGAKEVHLKVGASTAFVVLNDGADLADAVRAFDWTEYGNKKLRLSKSNKRSF